MIWEDTIPTGPELTEEVPVVPAEPQEAVSTPTTGIPVRLEGDRIYLLKDAKKHWITSAEAYEKLGFKFGDEYKIDQASFDLFSEGEPIQ